jgi:formylglycine-generating enzyme required for sulfatase activity
MKLVVPCLLILPALTAWFLWQELRPREAVGRVVADNEPVVHAAVRLGEQTAMTDEQGTFAVPFKNDDMPLQLLVEMKGYLPSQSLEGQAIHANRKWFYLSSIDWEKQYQIGDVQLTKGTGEPPSLPVGLRVYSPEFRLEKIPTLKPTLPSWWSRVSYPTALAVLAPVFLALAWLLYRFSRRAVLKRQSSRIPPELKQIQVQAGTQRLFPSLSLRHVTQRLRQPRFEESAELDVQRTIRRTIQRGGLFTPAFGSKREPSYVALIDRSTVADHQANVAAQLVKDLARGYVLVRQYEYDEQPTMVRRVDPLHAGPKHRAGAMAVATMVEVMALGEVTAKFPTSRLLCFADPLTCFDPLTGKIQPWVETLEAWEERFLFTTGTHGQWGQAARILSRRGFQVIPLTHLGLRLFSNLVEQGNARPTVLKSGAHERWGTYDRMPERWLDRHPPSDDTIARLLDDLQKQLKPEGFLWLAACAAYPEIHWALTLEWGARLFERGPLAESLLPKLTPLIWFRQAFMPDWFRQALYERLSGQEADRISQELSAILSALNPASGDQLQLHIATQPGAQRAAPAPVGRLTAWFQQLRRRSELQQMGQAAEPGSPMRDYIMLQYLSGKQGKTLTPYAPKALLTLLFPKGQPWLGFRPLFLVIAAGVVSAGLWWSEDPAPMPVPSPIQEIGFLPETNDVILKRENGRVERWGQKDKVLDLLESGGEEMFKDRLSHVTMGQLTVPDPTHTFDLVYQKEGRLRVTVRGDGRTLAQEYAPPAQKASLHWPTGPDAFLAVATADIPEIVKLSGLERVRQQESARRVKEKADAEAKARAAEAETKVKEAKIADAKRQAEHAAKKKADEARQQAMLGKKPQEPEGTDETEVAKKPLPATDSQQVQLGKQSGQSSEAQPVEKLSPRITGKDGAPMVLVPAGEFIMGSRDDDKGAGNDERPAHSVYLAAFYIDQYEVTTSRYAKFFQDTKRREPDYWSEQVLKQHGQKPVVGVDWNDASAYCAWTGKRLPTEAEWEKAARGTDQRLYPWGNAAPSEQRANFNHCCDFKQYGALTDGGSFEQGKSPYGAYDMAGNVWEWVADWYDETYYGKRTLRNPTGPSSGQYRVLRGGSWVTGPGDVRSANRNRGAPTRRNVSVGFRCAQDVPK